jgi:membrane protein implicated in regulation of membrane protease activity
MTHEEGIVGSTASWFFTVMGLIAEVIPLLQLVSFSLAITISVITLYRMLKRNGKK